MSKANQIHSNQNFEHQQNSTEQIDGRYGYGGYGYRRGYGAAAGGAAPVGAAAAGAYYGGGCGYDTYGNWVCPRY